MRRHLLPEVRVYSATTFWLAVSAASIIGIVAGALLARWLGPSLGGGLLGQRESQRAIDTLRQEQQHYRDQVAGHFQRTAELVNELTSNYRAVHNHLAQGAAELCPEAGNTMRNLPDVNTAHGAAQIGGAGAGQVEPPRDYAPRGRTALGPLHEAYGLDKSRHSDPEPPRH